MRNASRRILAFPPLAEGFEAQLRRLLRTLVLTHRCSMERVANLFNMETRILARRLAREGGEFRAVVGDVRYEIARHLLANTSLPLARIAANPDHSEPSGFTRAFHRWSGVTPAEWRTNHLLGRHAVPHVLEPNGGHLNGLGPTTSAREADDPAERPSK